MPHLELTSTPATRAGQFRAIVHRAPSRDILAVVYFAAVTTMFAWPALLRRSSSVIPGVQSRLWPWQGLTNPTFRAFPQRDGAVSSYPWSVTYHNAIRGGTFPFWDWHSFSGGYDVASDGVSGAMYPVHWVLWGLFNPPVAHDAYMALHLFLGGVVMYVLLRHWQVARVPAALGGTVWMLSAFNVGWLQAEMITPVLLVVPLVFWRVSCALRRGSVVNILVASGSLALCLVAGNVVVFLVIAWMVALYAVAVVLRGLFSRTRGAVGARVRTLGCVAVGAVALSAYSLVPTVVNLLSLGRRTATLSEILPVGSSPVTRLAHLWVEPSSITTTGDLFALGWCGRVALVLAVLGLCRRGATRFGALALVLFFTLLPSTPLLVRIGWYVIPPLRAVSGFGRLTFMASFGIAVLAAFGAAWLTTVVASAVRRVRFASVRGLAPTGVVVLMIGATLVELVPFAVRVNPPWTARRDIGFFPATGAEVQLAAPASGDAGWPGLMLPLTPAATGKPGADLGWAGTSFWGATSHVSAIDSVGGYDSAVPWRATSVTRVMQGTPIGEATKPFGTAFLPDFSVTWARLDLMARMGVTYLYAPPGETLVSSAYYGWSAPMQLVYDGVDGRVWELPGAVRGPHLVGTATLASTPEAALGAFMAPGFDARTTVVLEAHDGPAAGAGTAAPAAASSGTVSSAVQGSNSAAIDFTASDASWLVVPIGYSTGWRAEVDGVPVDVRPANFAFSAVPVGPGQHRATFQYRPPGFQEGAALTWAALVASLLLVLGGTRRVRDAARQRLRRSVGPRQPAGSRTPPRP